ncbi:MAG: PilZ domain-containing protein [Actinomycetia bacterium]|nr:PilZ domain-containing protein [Actinomycetes bacterium]
MTATDRPAPSFLDRLSDRYEVSLPCGLAVLKKTAILGREKRTPLDGVIDELSINGARIRVNGSGNYATGTRMGIEIQASGGVVRVRNSRKEDGVTLLGVEFMELTPELEQNLHEAIARMRGDQGQLKYEWERRGS